MHAHPFTEPMTGLDYVRARWYQPISGSWMTPDPLGHAASGANLYTFGGDDPVNRRDPTGDDAYDDKFQSYFRWYLAQQAEIGRQYKAAQERYRVLVNTGDALGASAAVDYWRSRNGTFGGGVGAAQTWFDAQRFYGNTKVLTMSNQQIQAEVFGDEAVTMVPLVIVPLMASINQARAARTLVPGIAPEEPQISAPPSPTAAEMQGPAAPAPYRGRRPYLRSSTVKNSWDTAPEGTVSNSKICPTCGGNVFGNPHTGELRNTPTGWDVEHVRKWEGIRRELQARRASPAEYREAYNDLNNTILRCRTCNRADNKVDN
jgi:RHS repeat-associated protein